MIESDDQRWLDIVIVAFERSGSRPSLPAIYDWIDRYYGANATRGSGMVP